MMSRTKRLTRSAIVSCITFVVLAASGIFPSAALSIAALAGLIPLILVLACGYSWAFGSYVVSGLLAILLVPDKTASTLFLLLFGYYGVVKLWIESKSNPVISWTLKILFANAAFFLIYFLFKSVFLAVVPMSFSVLWVLWVAYMVLFFIYDTAIRVWLELCRKRFLR